MTLTIKTLTSEHNQLRDRHNTLVADFGALVSLLLEKHIVDAVELKTRFSRQETRLDEILGTIRTNGKAGVSRRKAT